MAEYCVSLADVEAASRRIAGTVRRTPVMTCDTMDEWASDGSIDGGHREAFFKCELFQLSGSFKSRGAANAVLSLSDVDAARGVCTHSSGNHAQALAVTAKRRGIPAYIVMPSNSPAIKKAAVRGYGGEVIECAPTQAAREEAAARVATETGARFVHPSEDPLVIAGQGTIALELIPQVRELLGSLRGEGEPVLDAIIVPIGGGGMISGVATAAKGLDPRIRIIAAEPAAASDAARSKASGVLTPNEGTPDTMADGLKTSLGAHTWPIVRDRVDAVITVSEAEIAAAMRHVYERMKLAIEPSAAVGVAVLLSAEFKKLPGIRRVGVVLCGGNADVDRLPFVTEAKH